MGVGMCRRHDGIGDRVLLVDPATTSVTNIRLLPGFSTRNGVFPGTIMPHPKKHGNLNHAAQEPAGAATHYKEAVKRRKYGELAESCGVDLAPLVFDTLARTPNRQKKRS